MPFGLTNAPTILMDLMNPTCKTYLDKFVIFFYKEILIYSQTKEEHGQHLQFTMEQLRMQKFYAKFSKCEFWINEVHFLSHVVCRKWIHVDHVKIEAIRDWKATTTPTKVRQFLGLAGYYHSFIENFSKIAKPLTAITQKDKKFELGDSQEYVFKRLKRLLCSTLFGLTHWEKKSLKYDVMPLPKD